MGHAGLDLNSKTAVVIGGTSGIGLTLAKGLAAAAANVVPTGRRRDRVESVADEIKKMGRGSLAIPCDVVERSSLQAVLEAVCAEFGKIDILVNCAGITQRMPILDMSESDWNAILETNLNATLRSCQVFERHMIERNYGRIINICSLSSFVAIRSSGVRRKQVCGGFSYQIFGDRVGALPEYA